MTHGTINADGFGVGWYAPAVRPEPARYRRAVPMWTDASFASLAGVVSSGCVLAAVRSASVGMPIEETATAPFTDGQRLLSHNGRVPDVAVLHELLAAAGPAAPVPDSRCDSALVAALVWRLVGQGKDLPDAMAAVVREVGAADSSARLNLLATDGERVVATTWNDTLSFQVSDEGVLVASEPDTDEPGWVDVPDRRLLVADTQEVTLSSLISP
jgi:gamma-glutamyl hercynylcysteine S-oxide hydrolase